MSERVIIAIVCMKSKSIKQDRLNKFLHRDEKSLMLRSLSVFSIKCDS